MHDAVRDYFAQGLAEDARKTDKTRISLPNAEGYRVVRLILIQGQPPYVRRDLHFAGGRSLQTCNTRDHLGHLNVGPDPILKNAQVAWSAYHAAKATGNKDRMDKHYKLAKSLSTSERYHYLAVAVDAPDDGVKILTATKKLHEIILEQVMGNPKLGFAGYGADVFDLDKGRHLQLVKSKAPGGYMVYERSKFLEPMPFGTQEQRAAWLQNPPELLKLDPPANMEQLQAALAEIMGGSPPGDNEFVESIESLLRAS